VNAIAADAEINHVLVNVVISELCVESSCCNALLCCSLCLNLKSQFTLAIQHWLNKSVFHSETRAQNPNIYRLVTSWPGNSFLIMIQSWVRAAMPCAAFDRHADTVSHILSSYCPEVLKAFLVDFRDVPEAKGGVGVRKYFAMLVRAVVLAQCLQKQCPRRHAGVRSL
jgi:hypothetical protein